VVYQRDDSSRDVVCLRTWNLLQASRPYALVCCRANGEYGRKRNDGERYGTEYTWQVRTVSYSPVANEVIPPNNFTEFIRRLFPDTVYGLAGIPSEAAGRRAAK